MDWPMTNISLETPIPGKNDHVPWRSPLESYVTKDYLWCVIEKAPKVFYC